MPLGDGLKAGDPGVVARYLQIRGYFYDQVLAEVEKALVASYVVVAVRRIPPTLPVLVRQGFLRPGDGEIWPVVFLSPRGVSVAVCAQISSTRLAALGTTVNGPQRIRQKTWEGWWGWETRLGDVSPGFFELAGAEQDQALSGWYERRFEWLATNGLMRRRTGG